MVELLNCPFCGGKVVKVAYDRGIDIGCEPCGYTRHFGGLLQTVPNDKPILEYRGSDGSTITRELDDATEFYHHDADERAGEEWNRRATPPSPSTAPTVEVDERAAFEAWHRSKFETKHSTGQPTRDMHNGVYADKYGPAHQQLMWEAWQASAAITREKTAPEGMGC